MNVTLLLQAFAPLHSSLKTVKSLEPALLANFKPSQQAVNVPVTVTHDPADDSLEAALLGFTARAKGRAVFDERQAFMEYVFFLDSEFGGESGKLEVFRFYLDQNGNLWTSGQQFVGYNDADTCKAIAYHVLQGVVDSKLFKKRPTA